MNTLTKLFIVLQLVFAIAVSVIVVMTVSALPKYKEQVEAWQKATIAAQAALAREVSNGVSLNALNNTLKQENVTLAAELGNTKNSMASQISLAEKNNTELTTKISELTATNQTQANVISSLKTQYTQQSESLVKANADSLKFLNRSEEVNRENDKLRQENSQLTKALRMTQERLVETEQRYDALKNAPKQTAGAGGGAGIVGGGSVPTVAAGYETPINGPIGKIEMKDERTYFTLTLGTRDGLQKGMVLMISRGNSYIGDAEIVNTKVNEAVAVIKVLKAGQSVQTGDLATVAR
jgi:hypothetical protein